MFLFMMDDILEKKESEGGGEKGTFAVDKNEYKKTWWEKRGKKYKRITVRFSEEDFIKIENLAKKTKHKQSDIVRFACLNSLNDTNFTLSSKDNIETKKQAIQEALQIFRNLGTNINQIARDINERRLVGGFFDNNLTKTERDKVLSTVEKIESEFLKFINSNL